MKKELTPSEKFVKSLGDFVKKASPELLTMEVDKIPKRKIIGLASKILGSMTMGMDDYGLENIDFESLFTAYKEIEKNDNL